MKKLNLAKVQPLIQMAIEEDLGRGDVTSELLFKDDTVAKATIISREEIVVCGMAIARVHAKRRAGLAQFSTAA